MVVDFDYTGALDIKLGVSFLHSRVEDIVEDTLSLDSLYSRTCARYGRYIPCTKLLLKKKSCSSARKIIVYRGRSIVISHANSSVLSSPETGEVQLMVKEVD